MKVNWVFSGSGQWGEERETRDRLSRFFVGRFENGRDDAELDSENRRAHTDDSADISKRRMRLFTAPPPAPISNAIVARSVFRGVMKIFSLNAIKPSHLFFLAILTQQIASTKCR